MQTLDRTNWDTKTLKEIDAEAPHSVFMGRYQALIEFLQSAEPTPAHADHRSGGDWIDALDAAYLAHMAAKSEGAEDDEAAREWQDRMVEAVELAPQAEGWDAEHPAVLAAAEHSDAQQSWERDQ